MYAFSTRSEGRAMDLNEIIDGTDDFVVVERISGKLGCIQYTFGTSRE
jgi:hypothetical protein